MPLRVGVAGPLLGESEGWVPSPGEALAGHLRTEGHDVRTTSPVVGRVGRVVDTVRTLRRWRGDVDVAVVMVFSGPAFAMADVSTRVLTGSGIPVVLWLHGGNLPAFAERHPRWTGRVTRRAAAWVAPSGYLGELASAWDVPGEVVPNALPTGAAEFRHRQSVEPRLLWMRTFHDLYRPDLTVEVVDQLRRRGREASLTMAGQDKGLLPQVKGLVAERGLDASVRFPGFLDPATKRRELAGHDVFVSTARVDNAPVSLVEAAAAGLPVVAMRVGGLPDLFEHRETALLSPDGDPAAMADAVDELLDDAELASRLSAAGESMGRARTWEQLGPRWQRILEGAAGD